MSINSRRVLITGARAPVTLHLCRILKEFGFVVFAADCISYAIAKSSNSVTKYFYTPSPKFNPNEWVNSLTRIVKEYKIDILIPTCEETFYLSKYKSELSQYCDVFVDDLQHMTMLHHKETFIRFVEELGFKTPKTCLLTPETNQEVLSQYFLNQEIVAKKVFSRFSESVVFLKSISELKKSIEFNSSWIAQERIIGPQYCSYAICKEGRLLAHSIYRSEMTAGLGATLSFEYIKNDYIEDFTREIVEKLSYTGQISFDFILNPDGVPIPIECNPRATSGLHLFDKQLGTVFTNEEQRQTLYPEQGVKEAIKLGVLLYGLKKCTTIKGFKRWLKIVFTFHDAVNKANDRKPVIYQFLSMFYLWKDSRVYKNKLLEQSTYDISWDGEDG